MDTKNTWKKWSPEREFDGVVGGGFIHEDIEISRTDRIAIVSQCGKYGLVFLRERTSERQNKILTEYYQLCKCTYDNIDYLSRKGNRYCFKMTEYCDIGISVVEISEKQGRNEANCYPELLCRFRVADDDRYNKPYFILTSNKCLRYYSYIDASVSEEFEEITLQKRFLVCRNRDQKPIVVDIWTNKILFRLRGWFCEYMCTYENGVVFKDEDHNTVRLVFVNEETNIIYVTPEFENIRAEVVYTKSSSYLKRLFYKERFEDWKTISSKREILSQRDIAEITSLYK